MSVPYTSSEFSTALALVRDGKSLAEDHCARIFQTIMSGVVPEDDLAAFVSAQAERGPTVAEIVGAVRAMRGAMLEVAAPEGAIDLCGTGGDGRGTLNISTAVSFIVAAAGVPVAKHGNRSASSRSGAADVLEALGVKIGLEPSHASRILADINIVFLFAQHHHPAMRHVARVRARLGRRTIFNLLGPLANPAKVKRQLVGIFAKEWLGGYAEALHALGSERALVVHGQDGLDELTTTGTTFFASLESGAVKQGELVPEDVGLARTTLEQLKGGDVVENARALRRMLSGERGPYRDIVLLNAGAALMVADKTKDVKEGVEFAAQILDSGAAEGKLEALIKASHA